MDELKLHDEHSKSDSSADAEKKQLQEVIAKQRVEVASKAKAATAGWNAAAAADEEKELLAQKEYDRGYFEAMNKKQADQVCMRVGNCLVVCMPVYVLCRLILYVLTPPASPPFSPCVPDGHRPSQREEGCTDHRAGAGTARGGRQDSSRAKRGVCVCV